MGYLFLSVVGIDVSRSVVQVRHKLCGSIADDQGNRLGELGQGIGLCGFVGPVYGIGAGCQRQIHNCLRQVQVTFGHAVEVTCLIGGNGKGQRLAVG